MTFLARRSPIPAIELDQPIAAAYNQAGDRYLVYADGDPAKLFSFDGRYAYGDRKIWALLDERLHALFISGAQTVRILDLGCGPGTWLRRVVTRASELGFRNIIARGFDIAEDQVRRARELSASLSNRRGVDLRFEVGNICERFPESDASIDLCLCLYGVLKHIPAGDLPPVLSEIRRVTRGDFITTVRAIGSMPTAYVGAIEEARKFRQDNENDRFEVEFQDGRRACVCSHLFGAKELRALVLPHLAVKDLIGLDLFHSRFGEDSRWNPDRCGHSPQLDCDLDRLEHFYCRNQGFIDHATHLLLVAAPHIRAAAPLQKPRAAPASRAPMPSMDPTPEHPMNLKDLVTPATVITDIRAGTKPEILAELAGRAAILTGLDRKEVFRALLDREAASSTGLGLGVAMPQARFKELRAPVALFARLGRPVDFHALDGRPVDMLFLLLGPEPATGTYLKLLVAASRALREPGVRERLRERFDAQSIADALQDSAMSIPFDRSGGTT